MFFRQNPFQPGMYGSSFHDAQRYVRANPPPKKGADGKKATKKEQKEKTLAALIQEAANSEQELADTIQYVTNTFDFDRITEFFIRLNVPRSTGLSATNYSPLPSIAPLRVGTYEYEKAYSDAVQVFINKQETQFAWHINRTASSRKIEYDPKKTKIVYDVEERSANVFLRFRLIAMLTRYRLERLITLLSRSFQGQLTPKQWFIARYLMRQSYMSFKKYLSLLVDWARVFSIATTKSRIQSIFGQFDAFLGDLIADLEQTRNKIESIRKTIQVVISPEQKTALESVEFFVPFSNPMQFISAFIGLEPQLSQERGATVVVRTESTGTVDVDTSNLQVIDAYRLFTADDITSLNQALKQYGARLKIEKGNLGAIWPVGEEIAPGTMARADAEINAAIRRVVNRQASITQLSSRVLLDLFDTQLSLVESVARIGAAWGVQHKPNLGNPITVIPEISSGKRVGLRLSFFDAALRPDLITYQPVPAQYFTGDPLARQSWPNYLKEVEKYRQVLFEIGEGLSSLQRVRLNPWYV